LLADKKTEPTATVGLALRSVTGAGLDDTAKITTVNITDAANIVDPKQASASLGRGGGAEIGMSYPRALAGIWADRMAAVKTCLVHTFLVRT
jgi:hypothetical protein